jgi:hypothetical protein
MVELRRALQENCTVREPLLNARYEKQEVSVVQHLQPLPAHVCTASLHVHTPSANRGSSIRIYRIMVRKRLNPSLLPPQVMDLYRMHLQNSEVPAKFSTLLQLRELLDIDGPEAEAIEVEVMQLGSSFSI